MNPAASQIVIFDPICSENVKIFDIFDGQVYHGVSPIFASGNILTLTSSCKFQFHFFSILSELICPGLVSTWQRRKEN